MNMYVNENKTSKEKIHEKEIVITKSNRVSMKGIMIRGKVDHKSEGVSSLDKPKYVQGKLYETVIGDENIVSIDKNYVVANKIEIRIVVSDESNKFDDTI